MLKTKFLKKPHLFFGRTFCKNCSHFFAYERRQGGDYGGPQGNIIIIVRVVRTFPLGPKTSIEATFEKRLLSR